MAPASEYDGKAEQPSGPAPKTETSNSRPRTTPAGMSEYPVFAFRLCRSERPGTSTVSTNVCEFVVPPTAITEGASPGESTELKVGVLTPSSPSFPAAATITIPALAAFSNACPDRSQGTPGGAPQAAPVSRGPVNAGPPLENDTISMPSLIASSNAWTITSSVVKSFTWGEP